MQLCERCDQEAGPLSIMKEKLRKLDIDPDGFFVASPETRRDLMLGNVDFSKKFVNKKCPDDMGIVVVKPEMFTFASRVERYMTESRDLEIVDSQSFVYSPEVYYAIYKRLFTDHYSVFPHGSLLMLAAISLESQAILFRHNNTTKGEDAQQKFNDIEKSDNDFSIRNHVTLPIIQELGFSTMDIRTCSGKCFDPSGRFSQRTIEENERTFNGLHIPNNKEELDSTFTHLSDIIESWAIM